MYCLLSLCISWPVNSSHSNARIAFNSYELRKLFEFINVIVYGLLKTVFRLICFGCGILWCWYTVRFVFGYFPFQTEFTNQITNPFAFFVFIWLTKNKQFSKENTHSVLKCQKTVLFLFYFAHLYSMTYLSISHTISQQIHNTHTSVFRHGIKRQYEWLVEGSFSMVCRDSVHICKVIDFWMIWIFVELWSERQIRNDRWIFSMMRNYYLEVTRFCVKSMKEEDNFWTKIYDTNFTFWTIEFGYYKENDHCEIVPKEMNQLAGIVHVYRFSW